MCFYSQRQKKLTHSFLEFLFKYQELTIYIVYNLYVDYFQDNCSFESSPNYDQGRYITQNNPIFIKYVLKFLMIDSSWFVKDIQFYDNRNSLVYLELYGSVYAGWGVPHLLLG